MTPERWQQIKQVAGDALDIDPTARPAFLEQACAGDPDLHAEVASLLMAEDSSGQFLEPDRPLERIGVYRVVREIGRGGMGAVYLGERADGQFEQRVAIKVIQRGMDTRAVLRRFFAERQILARLQHPNIARLFDGGITTDGRPYFVMEYLEDAEPIIAYSTKSGLSVDQRLVLFLAVCEAVEYSHRHLVLHRDIKPANIMVDAAGTPKLLDFGIAKLLEADGEAAATELGPRAMTPQYSSPEQMRGEPLTTASDVYGLGLLLYELLTGDLPYQVPAGASTAQLKVVCEQEPARPVLESDLASIVLKALEKDPARRYQGAADLAADIANFRAQRPVTARSAGVAYRLEKYAARHWRGLAIGALMAVIVAGALINALIQGRRAQRHFQEVRQLSTSFLFEFHDAIANLPGSTPARELVVKRALQYLDGLSKEAAGDVGLKKELAESYLRVGQVQGGIHESNLGHTADATASFEKGVALLWEVVRARPSDLGAKTDLARGLLGLVAVVNPSNPARAAGLRRETIALLTEVASKRPLDYRGQLVLAQAYFGDAEAKAVTGPPAEVRASRDKSVELFRDLAAKNPQSDEAQRWLAQTLKRRASYSAQSNDLEKAKQDLSEAIPIDQRRLAKDPGNSVAKLDLALSQGYLAVIFRRQGDLEASGKMLDECMSTRSEILRVDPRNVRVRALLMVDYARLAALRRAQKKLAAAMAAVNQGFELGSGVDASVAANIDLQQTIASLDLEAAQTLAAEGKCQEAAPHLTRARKFDPAIESNGRLRQLQMGKCSI